MKVTELGLAGELIRVSWYLSGILAIIFSWRKIKKFSFGYIFFLFFGPLFWLALAGISTYKKITNKFPAPGVLELVMILSWIPLLTLMIWFVWL